MGYVFTKRQTDKIKATLEELKKELEKVSEAKSDSGSYGDKWHEEGFKQGIDNEDRVVRRIDEVKALTHGAEIIYPKEQDKEVQIGNIVKLRYDDNSEYLFRIEGYVFISSRYDVSIYSPLGKAIEGAKVGDKKEFTVGDKMRSVTILEIYLPSLDDKLLPQ
ncbi:MAG: GreA/GreB family elongation factor [Patescibacteria group bacterium]